MGRNDMEIERKFLPPAFDGAGLERREIEQTYISTDPVIRLRRDGGAYALTVKGEGRMVRREFELPLTEAQYKALLPKAETAFVRKTRYLSPLPGGLVAEVDVYHGGLAPLITLEVEFPDEAAAEAFAPPARFGREVTQDARYSNAHLARYGAPPVVE